MLFISADDLCTMVEFNVYSRKSNFDGQWIGVFFTFGFLTSINMSPEMEMIKCHVLGRVIYILV